MRVCVKALRARRDGVLGKTGTPSPTLRARRLRFAAVCPHSHFIRPLSLRAFVGSRRVRPARTNEHSTGHW